MFKTDFHYVQCDAIVVTNLNMYSRFSLMFAAVPVWELTVDRNNFFNYL